MSDNAVATTKGVRAEAMERVVIAGDLANLRPEERVEYYRRVCESLGLNVWTKPFQYITLNGKLTLYATRTATDQLRGLKGVSIDKLEHDEVEGLYIVTVYGRDRHGRTDSEVGAVSIAGLKGEARANAILKAVTKAKRRLTLSLAGLGWLDETEVGSVPSAQAAEVDQETGEIRDRPSLRQQVSARREAITTGADPDGPTGSDAEDVHAPDEPPHPADQTKEAGVQAAISDSTVESETDQGRSDRTNGRSEPDPGDRGTKPAPSDSGSDGGEPAGKVTSSGSPHDARCDAFDKAGLGACQREMGHELNHRAKSGESWR